MDGGVDAMSRQRTGRAVFQRRSFVQGTNAWLAWRREGIGASDAPIIMGDSPWTSVEELIAIKAGRAPERQTNWAMQRGKDLEPIARRAYVLRRRVDVESACLESVALSWMRASVDGLSADGRLVVEIKCPGYRDHRLAETGRCPSKYYAQLQHILALTELDFIDYWSYFKDRGALITVRRDDRYIARLVDKEREFWERVEETFRSGGHRRSHRAPGSALVSVVKSRGSRELRMTADGNLRPDHKGQELKASGSPQFAQRGIGWRAIFRNPLFWIITFFAVLLLLSG